MDNLICPYCKSTLGLTESLTLVAPPQPTPTPTPTPTPVPPKFGISVLGNKLVDQNGLVVRLRGVNRMSAEYNCVQGQSATFEGPTDQASIDAMKAFGANAVRLPLNEHCWLGVEGTVQNEPYRAAVQDYVNRLVASGLYVILDLHWSAPAGQSANGQQAMPNTSYSRDFWNSVATRFKGNPAVLFDVFNEPIPNNNANDDTDNAAMRSWSCWRDGSAGGNCDVLTRGPGAGQVAGMQALVDAVRATGATNVIVLGGIQWANTLWSSAARNILVSLPNDPLHQLVASLHVYEDTWTRVPSDWDREVAPVVAQMPVIFGEFGNRLSDATFVNNLMTWADAHGCGYVAWVWFSSGELRLANMADGSPTPYGSIIRTHYLGA